MKATDSKNKQTQDRTHEYTNTANSTNIPPNISNIIEIEIINKQQKALPETDDLTDYKLPNYKRSLSVSTDSYSGDGNKYPFLFPNNPKTTPTGNIKESTPNTIIKRSKLSQSLTRFIEKLDEMLKPIKPTLDDTKNNFILNYYKFKSLLENACSTDNLIDIIKDYSTPHDRNNSSLTQRQKPKKQNTTTS